MTSDLLDIWTKPWLLIYLYLNILFCTHMIAWSLGRSVLWGSPVSLLELSLLWSTTHLCPAVLHVAHLWSLLQLLLSHPAESQASFWAKTLFSFSNFLSLARLNNSAAQLLITYSKEEECIWLCTSVCMCRCVCVSHIHLSVCSYCTLCVSVEIQYAWGVFPSLCMCVLCVCMCVCSLQWACDTASVCRNLSSQLSGCVLAFSPCCILVFPATRCCSPFTCQLFYTEFYAAK